MKTSENDKGFQYKCWIRAHKKTQFLNENLIERKIFLKKYGPHISAINIHSMNGRSRGTTVHRMNINGRSKTRFVYLSENSHGK